LLKSGNLDVESLISHRLRLEEFQKGVEIIENVAENVRKVIVMPNKN
jgi:threonine dehydrogenase-like Zn-dependent dehydrogenase